MDVKDVQRRESLKILKESRLRTTKADKLMALLKPIDEIKRELQQKQILSSFNEIHQRNELASDLLVKDKHKQVIFQAIQPKNRDLSFRQELMLKAPIQ